MQPRELLEGIFDEKRVRILKEFVNKPNEEFYLREMAKTANVSPATTYRVLNQLKDQGVLKLKVVKKTKLYSLADNTKVWVGQKKIKKFVERSNLRY